MNIYVDGENIAYKDFDAIKNKYLEECHKILSIKIYGDWSREDMKKWYTLCKTYSIDQKQCINIPKKGAVDFNIVIDIMDDIYNDIITNMRILKKILIVSSDSDFLHIHNRIVRFNIDAEVYSPRDYQSNKYREHDMLFNNDASITIDNSNRVVTHNTHTFYNHENDTDYYTESDSNNDDAFSDDAFSDVTSNTESQTSDMSDTCNIDIYNNTLLDEEEYDHFTDQNIENCMKNVLICFRWINKKKKPYKATNVDEFNKTYDFLSSSNILENVTNFDKMYNYLFYTNKLVVDSSTDNKKETIKPGYYDEVFYKYGLINVKINDLCMCYRYNNIENKHVLFKQFYTNMQFLKDKNVLLEKLVDKSELEYNLKNNVYTGFELKQKKKQLYVVYK